MNRTSIFILVLLFAASAEAKDYCFKFRNLCISDPDIHALAKQETVPKLIQFVRAKGITVLVFSLPLEGFIPRAENELDAGQINLPAERELVDFYRANWAELFGKKRALTLGGLFMDPEHVIFTDSGVAIERRGAELPILLIKSAVPRGVLMHESVHALLYLEQVKRNERQRSFVMRELRRLHGEVAAAAAKLDRLGAKADGKSMTAYSQLKAEYIQAFVERAAYLNGEEIDVSRFLVEHHALLGITDYVRTAELRYFNINLGGLAKLLQQAQSFRTKGLEKVISADGKTLRDFADEGGKKLWDDLESKIQALDSKYDEALKYYSEASKQPDLAAPSKD